MILHADSSTRYCGDSRAGDEGRLTHREHDPEKWEPVFGKDHALQKRS